MLVTFIHLWDILSPNFLPSPSCLLPFWPSPISICLLVDILTKIPTILALHPSHHPLCRQNFPRIHWEPLGLKTSARGVRDKAIVRGGIKLLSFFLAFRQSDDVIKVQVIILMAVKE